MKKNILIISACVLGCAVMLTACGSETKKVSYKDGTYTAQSSVYVNDDGTDEGNGYGVVTITIKDGVISDCTYETFEEDGSLKDSDYGKQNGEIANTDYYSKAQKAVSACEKYAKLLVEQGKLDGIDAFSGATVNYNEFVEAVNLALAEAEEK